MLRIVLTGEDLAHFNSLGFDDHVKVFFSEEPPVSRDFTPRYFDIAARVLWIDFYLHAIGPAASWAAQASAGQTLTVAGPRGSAVIAPDGIDSHILMGDETALPAVARRLEELPSGHTCLVIIESDGDVAAYPLQSAAAFQRIDIVRDQRATQPGAELLAALREVTFPTGQVFVWVATESQAARAIRRYLINERGLGKHWIKAAGYWQRGATGSHELIADEG